ncbi:hypothetical protein [Fructobacillus evanidus]|uniref:Integral membrane protein n=1 Tax=Fructobacillus evanidus TaxID=3064281 RepID=A0ABN9YQA5_9LACO|nr:unnamed protein product [Fructobacillus sp. LMG 32999]CAK1233792.1 unnamed protein product [Fructobacillus sp. LMG 32999]CAK1235907.1 unnamed protein product [Fructobacillus sp. LMG 32999]CAK1236642.1 unnamed protein product [Fructobacillus sp. LMG 32999]CAK1237417.1 unnamed protein product [Fructobacillus sp. LMG 32999]
MHHSKKKLPSGKTPFILAFLLFALYAYTKNIVFFLGTIIFLLLIRIPQYFYTIKRFYLSFMLEVRHKEKYRDALSRPHIASRWINYFSLLILIILFVLSKSWYFLILLLIPAIDQIRLIINQQKLR